VTARETVTSKVPFVKQSNPEPVIDPEKAASNKRLETMGWGLFLILLSGFMFVPKEMIPRGIWSIGVGLIILGLDAARYFNRIRMSGFTPPLGFISVIGDCLESIGWSALKGGISLLSGPVDDQAALHALVAKLRDLGVKLISVNTGMRL
jgi:hypothetical protein